MMLREQCIDACRDGVTVDEYGERRNTFGYDWVDPTRTRTKQGYPYSYDAHYLWRDTKMDPTASAVYSDRMMGWDFKKFNDLLKSHGLTQMGMAAMTRKKAKKFLSEYFGKKCIPVAYAQGCNQASGYPYWIFWYKEKP